MGKPEDKLNSYFRLVASASLTAEFVIKRSLRAHGIASYLL